MLNISSKNALQIVTDISKIIGQHVNMMDAKGTIIASTNPARIGTHHEAASIIVREGLQQLVIKEEGQYVGSRKGLNLPVLYEGAIVGVIGVTGEVEEVEKYGQIIKKMTEILLLENNVNYQKKMDERILTPFLDEWLFENPPHTPAFIERGRRFAIDVTIPRRVLVAELAELERFSDSTEGQQMIDTINKTVRKLLHAEPGNVFTKTASQMVCLVCTRQDESMATLASAIQSTVYKKYKVEVLVGIDSMGSSLTEGYRRANKAVKACKVSQRRLCFYEDVTVEIFMDEISRKSKTEFAMRMFRGFTAREVESYVKLLQVYFDCNGSLGKASEQLYIHKNTLQYKLNRLQEKTGYNPRNLQDAALYYLALQFYEQEEK